MLMLCHVYVTLRYVTLWHVTNFTYNISHRLAATIGITKADASDRLEDTIEDITHQFSIIVNSVDARFRGIQGSSYVIHVLIAGIFIAQVSYKETYDRKSF